VYQQLNSINATEMHQRLGAENKIQAIAQFQRAGKNQQTGIVKSSVWLQIAS